MKTVCNFEIKDNCIELYPSGSYKAEMIYVLKQCEKDYNSFCTVEIKKPYKKRTTGKGSQNNKYWALATQIATEIGEDLESVHQELKQRAIAKGYPSHISRITGRPIADSSTKTNTVEFSLLIETAYEVGAFLGITFDEGE